MAVLHEGAIAVRGEPSDLTFLARAERAYFDGKDDAAVAAVQG
nr:hypothetical protein [Streptomyces sp. F001]